jgi:cytochrome P450
LQAARLAYRPFQFLTWCRDAYGDSFTIKTPTLGRTPIFSRPAEIEQILALDGDALLGGVAQAPVVEFAGNRSLMKLDGPVHQAHREILTRALRPSALADGGANLLAQLRRGVSRWPIGKRFNLGAATDRLALELVATLAFDGAPPELIGQTTRAMHSLRCASSPLELILSALVPYERARFGPARRAAERYIAERTRLMRGETSCAGQTLFERLATQRSSSGSRLDSDDLRDELLTVLTAMLGALTCAVKHAFYWVLRTPEIAPRIRDELSGTFSTGSPQEIMSRPYLDAMCKEVLRLCPDIPFAVRRASIDVSIGSWKMPAGMTLGLGIYLLHRREASFQKPDRFIPERFLTTRASRFEYLPFGGGRRGCVAGPLFVFLEKLILAAALERYHLRLCDPRENPVTSLSLVSTPARPLWVIAQLVSSRRLSTQAGTSIRVDAPSAGAPGRTGPLRRSKVSSVCARGVSRSFDRGDPSGAEQRPTPIHPADRSGAERRATEGSFDPGTGHDCPSRGAWKRG